MKEINIREKAENISNMKKWNILPFFRYLLVATSPLNFCFIELTIVSVVLASVILYYLHDMKSEISAQYLPSMLRSCEFL